MWDGGICEFASQGDLVVSPPGASNIMGLLGSWRPGGQHPKSSEIGCAVFMGVDLFRMWLYIVVI